MGFFSKLFNGGNEPDKQMKKRWGSYCSEYKFYRGGVLLRTVNIQGVNEAQIMQEAKKRGESLQADFIRGMGFGA